MKTTAFTFVTLALLFGSVQASADVCTGGGYTVSISEKMAIVKSDSLNVSLPKDKWDGDPEDRGDTWPSYSNGSNDVTTNITVTYYNELEHQETKYHASLEIGQHGGAYLNCEDPQ